MKSIVDAYKRMSLGKQEVNLQPPPRIPSIHDPKFLGFVHNYHNVSFDSMPEHHKKVYDAYDDEEKDIYNMWRNVDLNKV